MQTVQHKNIVKCHKVYKAATHWVFVLEYLKGGMLLNDLSKVRLSTPLHNTAVQAHHQLPLRVHLILWALFYRSEYQQYRESGTRLEIVSMWHF